MIVGPFFLVMRAAAMQERVKRGVVLGLQHLLVA